MSRDASEVSIVVANESQRLAAFRLRYDVFTTEEGDDRYANHEHKIFVDEADDDPSNPILVAIDAGEVIGTIRILPRRAGPVRHEEYNGFPQLAASLGVSVDSVLSRVAMVTRGVVHLNWRRGGLFRRLVRESERWCTAEGYSLIVGLITENNQPSTRLFEKENWSPFGWTAVVGSWRGVGVYKNLGDPALERAR